MESALLLTVLCFWASTFGHSGCTYGQDQCSISSLSSAVVPLCKQHLKSFSVFDEGGAELHTHTETDTCVGYHHCGGNLMTFQEIIFIIPSVRDVDLNVNPFT